MGYCNGPGHVPNLPCTGVYTSGSEDGFSSGVSVVRIGDTGITDCGHMVIVSTGSDTVLMDQPGIHRVGDIGITEGGGIVTATSGDDTVISG